MKAAPYYVIVALAVVTLALAVTTLVLDKSARALQTEFSEQTRRISQGTNAERLIRQMLGDLARISVNNAKIKDLLARNGYTVEVENPSAASAQPAEAPAAQSAANPTPAPSATPARTSKRTR